jgi:hypothetical protein
MINTSLMIDNTNEYADTPEFSKRDIFEIFKNGSEGIC